MIDRDQRRYWQEERGRRGLVPARPGFGRSGLMGGLDLPGALVTTLPSDPLRPVLDAGDLSQANAVLPGSFQGWTANGVSNLQYSTVTNEAAVRFARFGGEEAKWRGFAALRQDGGIDVGMGSTVRFTFRDESPLQGKTAHRLFTVVHAVRVAIESQARLLERRDDDDLGPFELLVAMPDAGGSVLSGFADGWSNPEYDFEVRTCPEADLFLRREVDPWPVDPHRQEDLLVKVATRLCAGFNLDQPCFLPRLPAGIGVLTRDYA